MNVSPKVVVFWTLFTSCSVTPDPVPDGYPNAKTYTSVINTINLGNSGTANAIDTVKTSDGIAKLRLDVTGATGTNYIYILKASDNGIFYPMPVLTITNSYGTFDSGNSSTYSLKVPNLTRFVVDIPVTVRNSGTPTPMNDVYKIWLTNIQGAFTLPAYDRTLGMATINLLYNQSALPNTFTYASVSMGSQSSRNYGSQLVATGAMTVRDSTGYVGSPESVDISLVTLTGGKKDNNSADLWLYSPADVTLANPAVSGQDDFVLPTTGTSNTTYFDVYTGTTSFDSLTAATLVALPTPSYKSVEIALNGVYIFQTHEGKKGLIKILGISSATSVGGKGSTAGQNISATVKVLN
ncbi:MAG: hypothetical protein JWO58_1056 [Chitinophagaceae bacterium]|nr:hypothetical protein [Chitinophagaceae bacterium]